MSKLIAAAKERDATEEEVTQLREMIRADWNAGSEMIRGPEYGRWLNRNKTLIMTMNARRKT